MSDLDKIREKYSLKKDPPKEKDLRKPASLTDKQEMEFLKRVEEGLKNKREAIKSYRGGGIARSGFGRAFKKGGKV